MAWSEKSKSQVCFVRATTKIVINTDQILEKGFYTLLLNIDEKMQLRKLVLI